MFFILVFGSIFFLNILAIFYAAATFSGVHFRTLGATATLALSAATIGYVSVPLLAMSGIPLLLVTSGFFQYALLLAVLHYLNVHVRGVQFDTGSALTLTAALLAGLNWMFSIMCNLGMWLPW